MEISPTFAELLRDLEEQAASRRNSNTNHINTRFPLSMIESMDGICKQYNVTRSDLIRNAMTFYLNQFN